MMAVACEISLHRAYILALRHAMSNFSDDFGMIKREGFDKAMASADLSRVEVLDLLFTMWDNADHGKVSSKEFCIGISPLACPFNDLSSVIEFALGISDDSNRQHIDRWELRKLLTGINSTASYFGDSHLLPEEIEIILETVFEGVEKQTHKDCVRKLSTNPYVKRFTSGKKKVSVQFEEVLVTVCMYNKDDLVTEYILDDIDAIIKASTNNFKGNSSELGQSRDDIDTSTEQRLPPTRTEITSSLGKREALENTGSCSRLWAQSPDPPCSNSYSTLQSCTEIRHPPSKNSYFACPRTSSLSRSRDPPARMHE